MNSLQIECKPGASKQTEAEKRQEAAEDLEVLAQGIQAMLATYGFGAKTSSGFGIAKEQLAGKGKLSIRCELTDVEAGPKEPQPQPKPETPETPPLAEYTFRTLSELGDLTKRVDEELRKGGAV